MFTFEVTTASSITVFIITLVVLAVILYFFIDYWIQKKKLDRALDRSTLSDTTQVSDSVKDQITNTASALKGKAEDIMNDPRLYDPNKGGDFLSVSTQLKDGGASPEVLYTLMVLLKQAVTDMKENITTLSEPGFYQQSIETVLIRYPFYRSVMQLVSYIYRNTEITATVLDAAIVRAFGSKNSSELYVDIKGVKYYIILELEEAFSYYQINQKYVDKFLGISPK